MTERRLAAILHADVVGYSRLMAEDEAATIRTLESEARREERPAHGCPSDLSLGPGDWRR